MSTPIECQMPDALVEAKRALLGGQTELARAHLAAVLFVQPEHPPALHLLAMAEAGAQRYPEAVALLVWALSLEPGQWIRRIDLGTVYSAARDWKAAAEQFAAALQHERDHVRALEGYGRALIELGEYEKARSCFARLAVLASGPGPVLGLARAYMRENRFDESAKVLLHAQKACPDVEYLALLGDLYIECGEDVLAREAWESVAELSPGEMGAVEKLVLICWKLGDLESTLAHCRRLIDSGCATLELYSFFVYVLLYSQRETPESIKEACESFGLFLRPAQPARFRPRHSDLEVKRLRIGYLSGEFTGGAAFYFLSPLLGNHDRDAVEVFCYHTRRAFDDQTRWYQGVSNWRDCRGWDDETLLAQIRSDEIDILVDLSGFYPEHRLRIFAHRAAPVQATYPNCPITTGIKEIDYIFTDRWTCPAGSEGQYTEQAVRLPSGYLAYATPAAAPPLSPLPAAANGVITFGLFQRRAKMNAGVWDLIAEIVRQCPGSRLLIQNGDPFLHYSDSHSQRELLREFAARGVDGGRLDFIGACTHLDTLTAMARADVALDTFPYQGQTTTCECLWMGVPVIALSGRAHVARVGSAILQRAGLAELVAETRPEHVRIALRLENDLERLSAMRGSLRDRMRASPVVDGRQLAREVETAYRWMWGNWCAGTLGSLPIE
jgi:predicted O-linked N-acetylglucosamine transferase (SPINDLY family)